MKRQTWYRYFGKRNCLMLELFQRIRNANSENGFTVKQKQNAVTWHHTKTVWLNMQPFILEAGKAAFAINAGKFTEAEAMLNTGCLFGTSSNEVSAAVLVLKGETGL